MSSWSRIVWAPGAGEAVMCAYGKAARSAIGNQDMSIEAAVVGIVDRVDLTDTKSEELREAARALGRDNGRPSVNFEVSK